MVNMGNIWDRTTEFLSDNAAALWPIAAVALFVPQSVAALMGGASAGSAINPLAAQGITLVCTLISLWGQLAIVALALDPDGGRPRAVAAATASYLRAIAAMLVLLIVVAVLSLPIVAILLSNGVDLSALRSDGQAMANLSGGSAGLLVCYGLIFAVVVMVVSIRLAMLYPVIVAEGGVVGAIRRAWALSRGIAWKMIGVWLLFIVVYLVAAAAITSAIGAVIGIFAPGAGPFGVGRIVVAMLSGLAATAFTLVIASFAAKLYRAVTDARDGVPKA